MNITLTREMLNWTAEMERHHYVDEVHIIEMADVIRITVFYDHDGDVYEVKTRDFLPANAFA